MKSVCFLSLLLAALFSVLAHSRAFARLGDQAWYCTPCDGSCDLTAFAGPGTCSHCGMALEQRPAATAGSRGAPTAQKEPPQKKVAILVFDGMEILDFAGPSEVFASAPGFEVYTVAAAAAPVLSQGFVTITPKYTLANCPAPDIVVVPGGSTDGLVQNESIVRWVQACATRAEVMLSVCTGAALLSKAGLLDGKQATTFHSYIDELQRITPKATILRNTRFVDNGQVITTAGISAGIDGALHVVARLQGEDAARQAAQYMEYDKWQPNQGLVVKAATPATGTSIIDKTPAPKAKAEVRGRKK